MRGLRPYRGVWPRVDEGVWVAENALVIGDVVLGADVSVWYGSVLRGDSNSIRVGARSNIQDHSVLHVTAELKPARWARRSRWGTVRSSTAAASAIVR